jgi:hypothetical protein
MMLFAYERLHIFVVPVNGGYAEAGSRRVAKVDYSGIWVKTFYDLSDKSRPSSAGAKGKLHLRPAKPHSPPSVPAIDVKEQLLALGYRVALSLEGRLP